VTASYLGSFTVGGALPGITVDLTAVGNALVTLRDVVIATSGNIQLAVSSLNGQAAACISAKAAIRVPAVASPEASLNAAINFAADFSVQAQDPTLYLTGLLRGLAEVQSNLALSLPSVAVNAQLAAALEQQASFELQVDTIDASLEALVSISAALGGISASLSAVISACGAAVAAASAALVEYLSFTANLTATGAHCLLVETTTANVGAELQAAIDTIGIGAGVSVRLPVVLVEASNTSASTAIDATFRVS